MKTRRATKIATALSLIAYLWVGFGVGAQYVYCVGSDGHSGIERAHGITHGATSTGAASLIAPESCTDIPLLLKASKEQSRLSTVSSSPQTIVSRILPRTRSGSPHAAPIFDSDLNRERLASIRSIVLRI
jgi:hypothetical protein